MRQSRASEYRVRAQKQSLFITKRARRLLFGVLGDLSLDFNRTRQVVSFAVGDRIEAACRKLWEQVPETYRAAHCYNDLWDAYQNFIPENQQIPCGINSGMRGSGSGVIMSPAILSTKIRFQCNLAA
jgi:hypothetical protein